MRCPICGEGVLADLAYEDVAPGEPSDKQDGGSVEIFAFTCGHESQGGKLATADRHVIDIERRSDDDLVVPPDDEGGVA